MAVTRTALARRAAGTRLGSVRLAQGSALLAPGEVSCGQSRKMAKYTELRGVPSTHIES